jgi:outer membrane receptor protein involved in Fe transport
VTNEELRQRSLFNIQDAIPSIPGLQWAGGTATPRFFQIRGIGEVEQYQGAPNPSIGVIIDDIDYSGIGLITPLFDLEQIEVLKGPQGIRFGSSALAGAINVRSAEPETEPHALIQTIAGSDALSSGAISVGGAIPGTGDRIKIRLSSVHSHQDGFRYNEFLDRQDTNERDQHMTRFKILAEPTRELKVQLTTLMVDNNNGFDAFSIANSLQTQSDRPGADQVESRAGALKLDYTLAPNTRLTSITSYARNTIDYQFDGDWGNNQFWGVNAPYDFFSSTKRERSTTTQEARLSLGDESLAHDQGYRSIFGAFMQRLDEDSAINEFSDNSIYNSINSAYRADSGAVFSDLRIPLFRGASLELGGRFERRFMEYTDDRPSQFSPINSMWAGHARVKRDISKSTLSYLEISRGFKGGGFNPGTRVPVQSRIYDPESLITAETGVKSTLDDGRLSVNLSAFRSFRENAQLKFAFQDNPSDPLSFTYVTESSGVGRSIGLESSIDWRAFEKLSFFSRGMIMNSAYVEAPDGAAPLIGRSYAHAPDWQFALGGRYQFDDNWFVQSDMSRQDGFYFDDSHNVESTPYSLCNLSLGYETRFFRITLWGKNILDENYPVRGFFFGNEPPNFDAKKYVQRGDPALFGLTISVML